MVGGGDGLRPDRVAQPRDRDDLRRVDPGQEGPPHSQGSRGPAIDRARRNGRSPARALRSRCAGCRRRPRRAIRISFSAGMGPSRRPDRFV